MSKLKLVLQRISKEKIQAKVLQRIFCQKSSWWLNQQVNETSVETNKHRKIYWDIFSKKRLKIRPPLGPIKKKGAAITTTFWWGLRPPKVLLPKIAQKVSEILKVYNWGGPFSLLVKRKRHMYRQFFIKSLKKWAKNCLPSRKRSFLYLKKCKI